MLAIGIFGMILLGIYATWSAIIQASKAGLSAAAQAQRARVSIKAIEDALTTAQMFSANGKYYWFLANTEEDRCGQISFVARLPATFPGVGRFGDSIVRRVTFSADQNGNLVMTQLPMLAAKIEETEPYRLQLAKDVSLFMFEFWDERKKEYVNEWQYTNQLPKIVRVALGLGKVGRAGTPQDLVTRTIAMPATAVDGRWQHPQGMPGMPAGMAPGMPPGTLPSQMQPPPTQINPNVNPNNPAFTQPRTF